MSSFKGRILATTSFSDGDIPGQSITAALVGVAAPDHVAAAFLAALDAEADAGRAGALAAVEAAVEASRPSRAHLGALTARHAERVAREKATLAESAETLRKLEALADELGAAVGVKLPLLYRLRGALLELCGQTA